MNLRCGFCQTPYTLGRTEILAALQQLDSEQLTHYDAHCPRCRRSTPILRQRLEMAMPNWRDELKQAVKEPVQQAPQPAPAKAEAKAPAKPAAKPEAKKPAPVTATKPTAKAAAVKKLSDKKIKISKTAVKAPAKKKGK